MNPIQINRTNHLNSIVLPGAGVKSGTVKLTKEGENHVFGSAKHHPALQWVKSLFSSTLREKNREIRGTLISAMRDKDSNLGLSETQLDWVASKIKTKFGTPLSVTTVRKLIKQARLSSLSSHERKQVAKAMRELKPRMRGLDQEQRKQLLAEKMEEILSNPSKVSKSEVRQANEFRKHIEEHQENLEMVEEDFSDFEEDFDIKPLPKVELRHVEARPEPKVEDSSSNDSPLIRELKQRFAKYPNPVDGLRKAGDSTVNNPNPQELGEVVANIKSSSNNEPEPISFSEELRSLLASIDHPEVDETIDQDPVNEGVTDQHDTPENFNLNHHLETPENVGGGNILSGDVSQELRDLLSSIEYESTSDEASLETPSHNSPDPNQTTKDLDENQLIKEGLEAFLRQKDLPPKDGDNREVAEGLSNWLKQKN